MPFKRCIYYLFFKNVLTHTQTKSNGGCLEAIYKSFLIKCQQNLMWNCKSSSKYLSHINTFFFCFMCATLSPDLNLTGLTFEIINIRRIVFLKLWLKLLFVKILISFTYMLKILGRVESATQNLLYLRWLRYVGWDFSFVILTS